MTKLLIADDDPSIRLLVKATLASEPYEVLEAASGDAALGLARKERPGLVVLDVRMPGLDGLAVCRLIKRDPDLHGVAVIMLTSARELTDRKAGEAAGADYYLTKPFSPIELLGAIDRFIDRAA